MVQEIITYIIIIISFIWAGYQIYVSILPLFNSTKQIRCNCSNASSCKLKELKQRSNSLKISSI